MRLTLSTLRCPDSVPPETRNVGGGEYSLGRAPDNSWVLQDPDRHLSKRHCIFAFRNGGWQVADTSTNGTFLNREAEPIGQGRIRDLRDGDRVRLGMYEIEIRIEEAALGAGPAVGGFGAGLGGAGSARGGSPFDDDPFAPAPLIVQGGSVSTGSGLGMGGGFGADQAPTFGSDSPLLPADFDPLAPAEPDPFTGPSVADHTPSFSDAFRPPPVSPGFGAPPGGTPNILPDDWDLDEPLLPAQAAPAAPVPPMPAAPPPIASPPAAAPPVAPPKPAPAAFLDDEPLVPPPAPAPAAASPGIPAGFLDDEPLVAPPAPPPVAPSPAAPVAAPDPFLDDEPLVPVAAAPVAPAPVAAPVAAPAASPFAEPDDGLQPVAPVIAHQSAAAAAAVAATAAAAPLAAPMAASPAGAPADGALLAAFLRGAGMPDARIENPAAMMQELGAAFRATVAGLRAVLIARAAIKGEFRIEQTMIRAKGNNPLKFSADDDDALAAIFGARRAGMPAGQAIEEALRDMRLHELATMAAMQAAVRDILKWLAPEEAMNSAGGGLLPVQKKARAFEAYEDTHKALVAALADDFDSTFGKAFARAYEEALREISARPEDR